MSDTTATPTPGAQPRYRQVPTSLDLPALDHEIIAFWKANDTFRKSWLATEQGKEWTFYEGPPTANGQPGTHHIEARVFKDVFPRFKTMQGFRVDRKAGWDCHGLPVELAVEAELGFDHKNQIEEYGIAAFNERCRESVGRNVGKFAELTERMGYWVDMPDAYWTLSPEYIDSEWWALKTIFEKGLLVEDYRVTPYCPHDETALSDHEVSQGYEDLTDPSVYVRMPLTSGPWAEKGAALLVWTTTPWTLVSNTAVAVHPEVTYQLVTDGAEYLVAAEPLFDKLFGGSEAATDGTDDTAAITDTEDKPRWSVVATIAGKDMSGWTYLRPFTWLNFDKPANFVVNATYVTTEDGTGLVHQAPAFGAEDMAVSREYGLPVVNPIRKDGTFEADLPLIGGQFFKTADNALVADLKARGLLFKLLPYEHPYPFCWRCHSPLIYYAQPSWYIRTTQRKAELLRENEATGWHPDTIKWGRYGDWLHNNIDWALSRTRYWGTPLPIWRNDADPKLSYCVGSRAELAELAGDPSIATMDPHRPFVDEITFTLPGVTGTYRRVPEVIDAWFDSGSMPFAQWGYPWVEGSVEQFESHFPADFIAEAIDQTRGWFYTLMAVSTLVFDRSSYRNVLCLGHILAEDGRKMSKHLGNILLPIPLMDDNGADAVRWFMACAGSPWSARRVGNSTLQEVVRKVLLTYWNTVSFQALYARANEWSPVNLPQAVVETVGSSSGRNAAEGRNGSSPADPTMPANSVHVLDRWLMSATQQLVLDVTAALDSFDTQRYGQLLSTFIDDLSNWYVRRSRRRFWDGDPGALQTLHTTLDTLTRLLAPMVPFITEKVWQSLFAATDANAPESVHLASWPVADETLIEPRLNGAMSLTRSLVELGRAARAEAKVKTRQPLARALISSAAYEQLDAELVAEICAELNVGGLSTFASAGDVVDVSAKGNFRNLGKRFAKETPVVAQAIAATDAAALSAALAATGTATVEVPDMGPVTLTPDDVIVTERPREGWAVLGDQGETIALDLELTPELVAAGIAREIVRLVQDARKTSGFDVSDRIELTWAASAEAVAAAFRTHRELIASEVLAVTVTEAASLPDEAFTDPEVGIAFTVSRLS
ncbi:MAG: isoleucine--tRNA ligase [Propionibacteriaceae bacterium]|nr:isoleucine--tRNA ligase [Propionibacteriaceae bacterium]